MFMWSNLAWNVSEKPSKHMMSTPLGDPTYYHSSWPSLYYNTPILHFGPYVTFQPRVRHILAHYK